MTKLPACDSTNRTQFESALRRVPGFCEVRGASEASESTTWNSTKSDRSIDLMLGLVDLSVHSPIPRSFEFLFFFYLSVGWFVPFSRFISHFISHLISLFDFLFPLSSFFFPLSFPYHSAFRLRIPAFGFGHPLCPVPSCPVLFRFLSQEIFFNRSDDDDLIRCQSNSDYFHSDFRSLLDRNLLFLTEITRQTIRTRTVFQITRH